MQLQKIGTLPVLVAKNILAMLHCLPTLSKNTMERYCEDLFRRQVQLFALDPKEREVDPERLLYQAPKIETQVRFRFIKILIMVIIAMDIQFLMSTTSPLKSQIRRRKKLLKCY